MFSLGLEEKIGKQIAESIFPLSVYIKTCWGENETLRGSNNGLIFSDGIETDFLKFNSGTIATIGIEEEKANLVMAWKTLRS